MDLLISRGPGQRVYLMPDLSGRNAEEAAAILGRAGLRVAGTKKTAGTGAPSGVVISQEPAAGSPVRDRQIVSLTVSQ